MRHRELADRVEGFLEGHQAPAVVERIEDGAGGIVKIYLSPLGATTLAKIRRLSDDIARAIGSESVEASNEGQNIVLFARTKDRPTSPMLDDLPPIDKPYTAYLGIEQITQRPVTLDFGKSQNTGVLVAGMTGFGKSTMIRCICLSLIDWNGKTEVGFVILEPKGNYGFIELMKPFSLLPVCREIQEAEEAIRRCLEAMEKRLRDVESNPRPHIFIVVDEAWEWSAKSSLIRSGLSAIASKGREANIHLIIGTQKPTAAALESLLKANMPVRIVGKVADAKDAYTASGVSNSGAEKFANAGEFLVITPSAQIKILGAIPTIPEVVMPPAQPEQIEPPPIKTAKEEVETWLAGNDEAREVIGRWIVKRNPKITDNAVSTAIWGSKNNADRQKQISRWRKQEASGD